MSELSSARRKGCAIGCGVLLVIPVLFVLVVGLRTCVPLGFANRARARLDDRFGPPSSFTPSADGTIAPDRVRAFLEVRRDLGVWCDRLRGMQTDMARVEGLDEREPSGEELVGATRGMASVAAGIAPFLGEFFEGRNEALLAAGMGLGEYSYLFALAYREPLSDVRGSDELFFEGGLSPRVLETLRGALSRQLAALNEAGATDVLRGELEQELDRMQRDPQRWPWSDGLPEAVERSLLPYREELGRAYCSATAGIEMDQDSRRALIIALY